MYTQAFVAATRLILQVEVGPRAGEALHHRQMSLVYCFAERSVSVLYPPTPHTARQAQRFAEHRHGAARNASSMQDHSAGAHDA